MSSDKKHPFVDTIFSLFGGLYGGALKGLSEQAPGEARRMLALLINEARKRSGLPPEKSLQLIVHLRDVLNHIIDKGK